MSKVFAVVSGKGGVGKTTVALNLSSTLSMLGFKTCVVDLNLTTPHLSLELGTIGNNKEFSPSQLFPNLWVITSPLRLSEIDSIDIGVTKERIKELKKSFDYIILDAAPGFGKEAMIALELAEEILIVTNPNLSSLSDAMKLKKLATALGKKISGIVINRKSNSKWEIDVEDIRRLVEVPVITSIPEDEAFKKYSFLHKPAVLEDEMIRKKFLVIAKWISTGILEDYEPSLIEKTKRRISRLRELFSNRF